VRATVTGSSSVRAYAATGTQKLTVVLVNDGAGNQPLTVSLGAFEASGDAQWYARGSGSAITRGPDLPVQSASVSLDLPSMSIGMLVVNGSAPGAQSCSCQSGGAGLGLFAGLGLLRLLQPKRKRGQATFSLAKK
jgi:hypothetical protein